MSRRNELVSSASGRGGRVVARTWTRSARTWTRSVGLAVLAGLGVAVLGFSSAVVAAPTTPGATEQAQVIMHMLDYIGVDYPEFVKNGTVVDRAEYDEQVEFSTRVREMLGRLPPRADHEGLLSKADELRRRILNKGPGADVSALATELRSAVARAYHVPVAPRQAPDLTAAPALYAAQCSACHGPTGRGDGPAGRALTPPPSDFTDRARMDKRSVYGIYSTITLGVDGTAMTSFRTLPDEHRWALALWLSGFAGDAAERARGEQLWNRGMGRTVFPDLATLVTLTADEVKATHGAMGTSMLAFLRTQPALLGRGRDSPLATSERLLAESLAAYRGGQRELAQQLALTAYLDGFELVEASLDAVDRSLRVSVEAEFGRLRAAIAAGAPIVDVERQATRVQDLLDQARERLSGTAFTWSTAFVGALVILLREGVEALLIVAAILAFLLRANRRDALRDVHAGWIVALALGIATWGLASYAITISGAHREVLEGVTGLLAAAILLYVGVWMHDKAYSARWEAYLEQRVRGALSGHTRWALAAVSFLAVYREAFETVLFTQALWIQSGVEGRAGVLAGLGVGGLALPILAWLILKAGVRLPSGWVFGTSSALLALLAIVLAGEGIAALQEAGILSVRALEWPAIPVPGIQPTVEGLTLQCVLLLLVVGLFVWTHRTAQRTAGPRSP